MEKSGFYLKIIFTFRPVIKEVKPKNLKQDPVKLHQFYKEHWEKTRLPGELNKTEKDLRWATREWMSRPQ